MKLIILEIAFLWLIVSNRFVYAVSPLKLGAYDPKGSLETNSVIAVDHIFISWTDPGVRKQIDEAAAKAVKAKRWLQITVEPWPQEASNSSSLLKDIAAKAYDPTIIALCKQVSSIATDSTGVFIRWGHEMDLFSGRYPWAKDVPEEYIAAYRHFVTSCRAALRSKTNVYFVWSPVGVIGKVKKFWPGSQYVDWIGLSVFDCPKCHGRPLASRTFVEIFSPKYNQVSAYNKPVMVAELGVAGTPEYQAQWMAKACLHAKANPQLHLLVYFNRRDAPNVWGSGPAPDWSIDPEAIEHCLIKSQ